MTRPRGRPKTKPDKLLSEKCDYCGGWALYPISTDDYPTLLFCCFKCYGEKRFKDLQDRGKAKIKNLTER